MNYAALLDHLQDAVIAADNQLAITFCNQAAAALFAGEQETILGLPIHYVLGLMGISQARTDQLLQQPTKTGRVQLEPMSLHRNGRSLCLEGYLDLVHDTSYLLVSRDVTAQKEVKKVQTQLHETPRFQAQLLNAVQQAVVAIDLEGNVIFWNHFAESLYGWTAEEMIGQSVARLVPAANQERADQIMARLLQGKSWEGEFTVQRRDGSTFTALVTDSPITNEQGHLVGIIGISRDTTAEKAAQQALRESEERHRLLVQFSPVPLGIFKDDIVIFANEAVANLAKAANPNQLIGRSLYDFVHPDSIEPVQEWLSIIKGGAAASIAEIKAVVLNGQTIVVEALGYPVAYQGEPIIQFMVRDITQQRQEEAETNRQLATEYQQRLQAEILQKNALTLISRLTPEEILDEILVQVKRVISFDAATIALLVDDGPRLFRWQDSDLFGDLDPAPILDRFLAGLRLTFEAAATGRPIVIPHTGQDSRWLAAGTRKWVNSHLVIPIKLSEQAMGFLWLHSATAHFFSEGHLERLQPFITAATIALENARLFEAEQQQQNQLRALALRLAEVEESTRRQLAQELHDQIGQNLTALDLNLNVVSTLLPDAGIDRRIPERLKDSFNLTRQTAERIRSISAELRPAVLDDYGLLPALHELAQHFSGRTEVQTIVQGEPTRRLPVAVETTLYRISEEALTNIAKHAAATKVIIKLETLPATIRLTIQDDGQGYKQIHRQHRGWGHTIMRERAEAIGGQLHLETTLGLGTQVIVEVSQAITDT